MKESSQRCAIVAIIGAPNAGKSTLVNQLVGQKISIISPKVQTTRCQVRGIAMEKNAQLVFIDTPGIFAPESTLQKAMVSSAWRSIQEADQALLLVDASRRLPAQTEDIITTLTQKKIPAVLALNKVDATAKEKLLPLAQSLNRQGAFREIFMISALSGEGVGDIKRHLAEEAPEGPWLYPEDQVSDLPLRLLAAEITREQCFLQLNEELPYKLTVETEQWKEGKDGITIHQAIVIARENHKAMIIGKGGSRIKKIGELARREMGDAFGRKVHLFLFVKHVPDWEEKGEYYAAMGLEFPK